MTRRTFSSLAATASALPASGEKIRVAVIGTGHGHALSKIRALRSMPEYELVGICRPDPKESSEGEPLRNVRWIAFDEILKDSSIELVAVESIDFDRNLEYAQQCIDANKFVHLDKPPGSDLARLRKLLDDARQRKRVVQMGYQWRYHPAMQAVMDAARNGWLGRVYRFRASIDKIVDPAERPHLAKFRGGMMFTEGCHLIDRAVALLGKPAKVTGIIRHDGGTPDKLADNTFTILEYGHALAEISLAGFSQQGSRYRYLEIWGTNGFARAQPYTFPSKLTVDLAESAGPYKRGEQTIEIPAPAGLAYTPDFREMAAIIRNGATPSYSPEHDLATHETLLRVCGMLRS